MTSGNAQTTGTSVAGNVSRKEGNNRLTFDAGAAYGRSNVVAPVIVTDTTVTPATNTITSIGRTNIETNNNWFTKGRYDRFFTPNNSGYVSAQAAGDEVAGKSFYGGGQIGYSRQVYKSEMHLLVAELGYDLSYERYVQNPGTTHDPVTVHSARIFAGETLTLTKATGITASVEALFNLNKEGSALQYPSGATRRRLLQGHPREREARPDDHALQADEHQLWISHQVRSEPGAAPHPIGVPAERDVHDRFRSLCRSRRHADLGDARLHVPLGGRCRKATVSAADATRPDDVPPGGGLGRQGAKWSGDVTPVHRPAIEI